MDVFIHQHTNLYSNIHCIQKPSSTRTLFLKSNTVHQASRTTFKMTRESYIEAYYTAIPICITLTIISGFMLVRLCIHSIPPLLKKQADPTITILMLVCALCSCLGCLNETLRFTTSMEHDNLLHNPYVNVLDDFFHFTGQCLFYVIALFRIKIVCQAADNPLHKRTMYLFMILICIQLAWNMWHVCNVIWAFFFLNETNEDTLHNVIVWPVMLMSFFSFVLNSSLIGLFVVKLRNVINAQPRDSGHEHQNESNPLMNALIKYTIIFGLAIFTNELFYISLIVNKYTESHGWYVFLARCLENFSNISALYLAHKANDRIYHKLCNKFHECLLNISIISSAMDTK
eukprot:907715_1